MLAERPVDRAVRETDFRLVEAPLPRPGRGELLVRTLYLSVAPVMRQYMIDGAGIEPPLAIGDVMRGRGVGQVVASNHPDDAPGDFVQGKLGWQEYSVSDGSPYYMMYKIRQRLVPLSTAVGVLGHHGLHFVSGSRRPGPAEERRDGAGVGRRGRRRLERRLDCPQPRLPRRRHRGHQRQVLDADRKTRLRRGDQLPDGRRAARIRELCPGGVDVFFDNVGGEILDHALGALNRYGRVVCCGRIAEYLKPPDEAYRLRNWHMVGRQRATMRGFFIYDFAEHFPRAERQMAQWIAEGRMRYLEDVLEGFEQMPRALMRLYSGQNTGKQLVRVDPARVNRGHSPITGRGRPRP